MEKLTNTERLSLIRLTRDRSCGVTRTAFADTIGLSVASATCILNSLVIKGYADCTRAKRNTRFWKIRDYLDDLPDTKPILPVRNRDDLTTDLQARVEILEEALHKVWNILSEVGVFPIQLDIHESDIGKYNENT